MFAGLTMQEREMVIDAVRDKARIKRQVVAGPTIKERDAGLEEAAKWDDLLGKMLLAREQIDYYGKKRASNA